MEADSDGTKEQLYLEPFIHQVSGHASMLQLDENTICKPLIAQELNFYKNSPEVLRKFLPEFKGVIEVTYTKDKDGYLGLTTYLPPNFKISSKKHVSSDLLKEGSENKVKHRIKICPSGSIQIEVDCEDDAKQTFEEGNHSQGYNESQLNPWVLHCHQEQLNKIRNSATVISQKYILLENLTARFEFPCILDIKMGTRPYGDDASLEKRKRRMAKAASTTSSTLGVRICGMQVYHQDSGHFICHNKYYGRSLTEEGFRLALYNFLHNGVSLRYDVTALLIEKLNKLYTIIKDLNTFRFFTSSLLVIYNGRCSTLSQMHTKNNFHVNSKHSYGVMLQLCDNGNVSKKVDYTTVTSNPNVKTTNSSVENHKLYEELSNDKQSSCSASNINREQNFETVDVRMIDFAHSTQSQMSEWQSSYKGPDDGYLFGLANLIAQLKTFYPENN